MAVATLGFIPAAAQPAVADDYLDLIRAYPLRAIRTDAEHDEALAVLDKLAVYEEGTLPPGAQTYFDALTALVAAYDDANPVRRPRLTPVESLRALMENRGTTFAELAAVLKSKGAASAVLNGKRPMNLTIIGRLAEFFEVDPGTFVAVAKRPKTARAAAGGRKRPRNVVARGAKRGRL